MECRVLRDRFVRAIKPPGRDGWLFALGLLAGFAALALPFGFLSGLLSANSRSEPLPLLLAFAVLAVFVPCLAEELVFRVGLIPHPSEKCTWPVVLAFAALSTALFVAWHPLNAALFLRRAWPIFSDPRFLILASLLGACCAAAYVRSGSVWPGVVLHWVVVLA